MPASTTLPTRAIGENDSDNVAPLLLAGGSTRTERWGEVRSPANAHVVGRYAKASPQHVNEAVAAATTAWQRWSATSGPDRERRIRAATAVARERAAAIAMLMAKEQGKPLAQCRSEVIGACECIDYYASEAVRIQGEVLPTEGIRFRSLVIRQSVGVVAAITPWNYPVALLAWKLGPALAAGCSIVVKPTPVTPLSPHAFCQALIDGGLGDGLIQVLTGDDAEVAQPLVTHPQVAKIAFTGSTATGRVLMRLAGPAFKKITLELGGQCPAIVLPDADLERTAAAIVYKAMRNMGQSCSAINRIYAHADIHDDLVARVVQRCAALRIGDGISPPDVDLGPMTTRSGRDRVAAHVADALEKGASLVYGGRIPAHDDRGNFYEPTVLTGMRSDMLVAREETFGPVAPFSAFTDLDAAITAANTSEYGLCGFVFTRDLDRAFTISERLEVGSVCINHVAVNSPYAPYEGWKASGVGVELSRDAVGEYLHRKHLKLEL